MYLLIIIQDTLKTKQNNIYNYLNYELWSYQHFLCGFFFGSMRIWNLLGACLCKFTERAKFYYDIITLNLHTLGEKNSQYYTIYMAIHLLVLNFGKQGEA